MKKYGFMEKSLFIVDNDGYYSSLTNKYIKLDDDFVFNTKHDLSKIDYLIKLSHQYNRIPILPKQECNKNNECLSKLKPQFGSAILYKYIINKNISFRESISFLIYFVILIFYSFLDNKLVPDIVKDNKCKVRENNVVSDKCHTMYIE